MSGFVLVTLGGGFLFDIPGEHGADARSFDVAFSSPGAEEPTSWRFVVMPDLHNAEGYLQQDDRLSDEDERAVLLDAHTRLYTTIHETLGGDLLVMPGDTGNGEWHTDRLAEKFGTGMARDEQIRRSAELVYPEMRYAFRNAGYETILFTVGDHELGDNPWWPGSLKDRMIPVFRETVKTHFTDRLRAEFDDPGRISVPVGTEFEGTSFALRYRNAVFVSVDQFRQRGSGARIWWERILETVRRGSLIDAEWESVVGDVSGDHLRWFEAVLAAAEETPGVERIVVFGHLPVLAPVRGRQSSMMYLEGGAESAFWQAMRRHGVDLYIAGEVHASTVVEDPAGGPVQITVKAGSPHSMVMAIDIDPHGLQVSHYAMPAGALVETGRYVTQFDGWPVVASGELVPVDLSKPVLSYDFEGSSGRLANAGTFGTFYDLVCEACGRVERATGNLALSIDGRGATLQDDYVSPIFFDGRPGTLSFWIRQPGETGHPVTILTTDAFTGREGFDLHVSGGELGMRVGRRSSVCFRSPVSLSDGEWHHVVLRHRGGTASHMDVWIDGKPATAHYAGLRDRLFGGTPRAIPWRPVRVGGDGLSGRSSGVEMDSLRYWARALDEAELGGVIDGDGLDAVAVSMLN